MGVINPNTRCAEIQQRHFEQQKENDPAHPKPGPLPLERLKQKLRGTAFIETGPSFPKPVDG